MPIESKYPNVDLQVKPIYDFIFHNPAQAWPDSKVIFRDADNLLTNTLTFAQVRDAASSFGRALQSQFQFGKSDTLAIFAPNDVETPIVVFGTLWAGGVVSPANPGYTVDEFAYQLRDSKAKVVVAHASVLDTVREACTKVGIDESHILVLGSQRDGKGGAKHWQEIISDASNPGAKDTRPKIDPKDDLAFLVYSSGTTGKPKGVELTHFNMTSNLQQIQATEGGNMSWDGTASCPGIPDAPRGRGDVILACLPFFHIYGLNVLIHLPLFTGIETLVLTRFEIEKFCRLIQDQKVTFSYIVPPMVLLLCKHPAVEKYDLSSLRMTNSGAAPLTRELVEAVYKRKGVRVKQGYGLSETSPTIFQQRWIDWDKSVGSTGRMVPNLLSKLCEVGSEEGSDGSKPKEVGLGETGELYVKGPNVFRRYHNNEKATSECVDAEGWFRTGDVGHIDKNGDLWITDRVKELIKYKGFQVPPAELEGYLADHELIDDVAVVGVESKELGTEVPRAYVVRKGGPDAVQKGDDEKIIKWLNAKVANHKKLRGSVRFVDAIPKSVSGKILRRVLKEQAKKEFKELEEGNLKAKL
ncbi:putative 4-coumarate--CoA ligase 1 [Cyphellophora attinorum]|uniref:Putative 4-coumarate--CoA ligase 1 n=1 Tax=Cyphellophora attinorum TaxID=1664694 RepID=A0A0N1HBF3_9EURO|nr:putative 4-coumarate--CoA ligase 1 [Phialophora attinorum]KPI45506.1 putative 4-coumarate--CoA ligase 1 [Phialophora attinorum]